MPKSSAGLLLFRRRDGQVEVLLAHPGGPFWADRDLGAWSIVKGEVEPGEEPFDVARREFSEETGHAVPAATAIHLDEVRQKSGKRVMGWALEADFDAAASRSNTVPIEWPPRSGRTIEVPEIDRVEWFSPHEARRRLNPAQVPFVDRLLDRLDRLDHADQ